jgi:ELWxxDGT repeat protein
VGTKVYFRATNGIVGNELWVSDGTLAGTRMVKDINVADSSNPYAFLDFDGTIALFAADDGENGMELWRTDGTEAGTWMLKDINEGGGHSSPNNFLKASASVIYFTANHDEYGVELWKTDGTAGGTVLVADLEPGAGSSSPGNLRLVGAAPGIVFTATTTAQGVELWKSNGTTAGTSCFDINADALNSSPAYLTNFNGYVYMLATETDTDRNVGAELYRTNGTTVELVQDIRVGTSSGGPSYLAVAGTTLFMYARDATTGYELYKLGTTGSVTLVKDIVAGGTSGSPVYITAISSTKVVFRATEAATGDELWVSDGTSAGTFRLADINPGSISSAMGVPVAVNGKAYFSATSDGEVELYETDGTIAGTVKRDVNPGAQSSSPTALTAYGTSLIFSGYSNAEGREPRLISGGTLSMLRDLNPQTSSLPGSFAQLGTSNTMIFAAQDPVYGRELYKTDGTLAGTVLLKDINTTAAGASSNPTYLVAVGPSHVFFRADDGVNGTELWRTDGTTAGTVLVTDIFPGIDPSTPNLLTALDNNTVLFAATDSASNGIELWKATTTSSPANPATLVKNLHTTANASSSPQSFALMGGKLYFQASDTSLGRELFVTDGTTAGTTVVKDIRSDGHATPASLTLLGTDRLLFSATETATGSELYVTDGTAAGTIRLTDIASGILNASPTNLRVLGNRVIFSAYNPTTGRELYTSDGTAGGTVLLKDIRVGAGSSNPSAAVLVGTKGIFQAGDDEGGIEVWMTDGTSVGTTRLLDVRPGTANSNSGAFVAIDTANLWFIGNEGVNGSEPWRSNLTAGGTYLIQDINTLGPSWGGTVLMVNGTVFFTATDGVGGVELWKY